MPSEAPFSHMTLVSVKLSNPTQPPTLIFTPRDSICSGEQGHNPDLSPHQMLLEKLNGTVPCLLDTSTIPAEELTMSPSRSIANPCLNDSLATGSLRPSNGDSPSHPYHRTFSPHFHHFVEQCLQRSPDARYSAGPQLSFRETGSLGFIPSREAGS